MTRAGSLHQHQSLMDLNDHHGNRCRVTQVRMEEMEGGGNWLAVEMCAGVWARDV